MIGEIVTEAFITLFQKIIFKRFLVPLFRYIGTATRWMFSLFQTPFDEVLKKDNNGLLGFLATIALVITVVIVTQV
jgi:hypothetical protein